MIKIGMVSGHGNGTAYTFLQDAIINVNYLGTITVDNFKYYGAETPEYDSKIRQYGDIFWVHDATNKVVDFYCLMGQWATVKMTPYKRLNSSDKGTITQHTTATIYSTGTKVWANNDEFATLNDIPTFSKGADVNGEAINITIGANGKASFTAITDTSIDDNKLFDHNTTFTLDLSAYAKTADLVKAMVFKGTLGATNGSTKTLPAATSATPGDTYKVIENGTYQGIAALNGDLLICSSTPEWVLIPSANLSVSNETVANQTLSHSGNLTVVTGLTDNGDGTLTTTYTTFKLPSDNNTDTKVTNTLTTNKKAYVTGTTSNATNTGTQIFDTDVYITDTAGEFYAKSHLGETIAVTGNGSIDGNLSVGGSSTFGGAMTVNNNATATFSGSVKANQDIVLSETITMKYNSTKESLDFIFA
jgi:hypothetical protein